MKGIFRAICIASIASSIVMFSACGGSGTEPDVVGVPTIETVGGSGTGGAVLDTLLVTGTNFDDGMDVYLVGPAETGALSFTVESANKFTAALPTDVEPGEFDLEVQNDLGKATAPLSLLQGEPGPQGEAGISLVHYHTCGSSGDIETDPNYEAYGQTAEIWEFSDGSYFIYCMAVFLDIAFTDADTSSAVMFVPSSVASAAGEINCIPMYVNARYFPATNTVRYEVNATPAKYEDVACSTVY